VIRTTALTKTYTGTTALDTVDFEVPTGSVTGLVGPNGAGKSTLLGLLAGLRHQTSGGIQLDVTRDQVALLPDTPRFDSWLTGREVVELSLRLSSGGVDNDRVQEVLTQAGLVDSAHLRSGGYSRGMLQRLGLAAAVVARPRLLMLDEPASALDPLGRREVLDLIGSMRADATVLFSSHLLVDVESVCDRVAILDHGRLLFQGSIDDLLGRGSRALTIEVTGSTAPLKQALTREEWVSSVADRGSRSVRVATHDIDTARARIAPVMAEAGVGLVSLSSEEATLEDVFLELTR
jgi:ABC-2 type transport system ATP-binding protein